MTEKTVQVPVSLIEQARVAYEANGWKSDPEVSQLAILLGQFVALSQPNPTGEQIETLRNLACDGSGVCQSPLHVHGCYSDHDGTACDDPDGHPTAEPPRIENMAPGTTFTAGHPDTGRPTRLQRCEDEQHAPHTVFDMEGGSFWWPSSIDPSTIRDVTPPKEDYAV